ncbi:hypothetical protein WR25_15586 [Diploscapter pachys]|uniref:Uncharacterized protein n=1 Tax=Diploscapter pachys TaxID=2018661 RepID=A0A2A2LAH1_9BILA|nr:hypothetical protein WR25_15586 [Diploscapter pachys]
MSFPRKFVNIFGDLFSFWLNICFGCLQLFLLTTLWILLIGAAYTYNFKLGPSPYHEGANRVNVINDVLNFERRDRYWGRNAIAA